MKKVNWIIGVIGSIALIVFLFITSFRFVLYSDIHFYEKEYAKYGVLDDVKMEMKDVLYVTEEMMKYLIDHRGDLVVNTTVDGVQREFFNDREKIHMQDVKNLFMGGIRIGWVAFFVMCCSILILKFNKADLLRVLPRAFLTSIGIVGSILAVFAYFVSRNFSAMFIQFHLLFFHNDYWILNPETDLMINILPENFFFDVVKAIGTVYGIALAVLFLVSVFIVLFQRRQNRAHK